MFKNTALLLLVLPMFASAKTELCSVPEDLVGRDITAASDAHYSPQNPYSGTIMRLAFNSDGSYTNTIFTNDLTVHGKYEYRKLSENVGMITAYEIFEGVRTDYTYTLNCLTNYKGVAVYTQSAGAIKPGYRQNTAIYTIQ